MPYLITGAALYKAAHWQEIDIKKSLCRPLVSRCHWASRVECAVSVPWPHSIFLRQGRGSNRFAFACHTKQGIDFISMGTSLTHKIDFSFLALYYTLYCIYIFLLSKAVIYNIFFHVLNFNSKMRVTFNLFKI